jgi:hypothetical protein
MCFLLTGVYENRELAKMVSIIEVGEGVGI